MIPNTIHYIFGLDPNFGGKPFSYVHYLAIRSAVAVNRPDAVVVHYEFEPSGPWWEAIRPYVNLDRVRAPSSVFDRPLKHYAHKADVLRLDILRAEGGIYLDLDVVCLRPMTQLRTESCVMGIEPNAGLCNAVLLARPNAPFLDLWYQKYRDFDERKWNQYSVVLPYALARQHPEMVWIMDEYAFFFPMYDDPMRGWLWGKEVTIRARLHALWRELRWAHRRNTHLPLRRFPYARHALASKHWYYQRLRQSYCIHLWESLWWADYLQALTPADRAGPGLFWQALREILPDDALMPLHIPLQNSEVTRPPLRACIDVRAVL